MTLALIITTSVLCGLGMWCAVYFITRPRGLQITVQDNLTGLKNFKVTTVGKKVVSIRSKKEAFEVVKEKRCTLQKNGALVGKLVERTDHVQFSYEIEGRQGISFVKFTKPKPEYPLGTMGYVWQDGFSERYLKKLLRVEDGRYVCIRSHPGGVNSYWDNFSPLDIYDELEQHKTALGDMAKHFCAYLCSTRDYAGGDKCTGCPLEKCVNNPRVELVQHFLKVAKPK